VADLRRLPQAVIAREHLLMVSPLTRHGDFFAAWFRTLTGPATHLYSGP
jgi:hypothetical protein